MIIERHPHFKKSYKKRILPDPKLVQRVKERLQLFNDNPKHPLLRDHPLTGGKNHLRSISVTGDIRIIYILLTDDHILLMDIGSHNQVY